MDLSMNLNSKENRGAIILTGPSCCGKGEIAKLLREYLNLPKSRHLSMGEILRETIEKAKTNQTFKEKLSSIYHIHHDISVFDPEYNPIGLIEKVSHYRQGLEAVYGQGPISQLDWLDFCVTNGLLIPDSWTESIINATFEESPELQNNIFILDGYPRTVQAARSLLECFSQHHIPVIKVLHLSISKHEMIKRAGQRKRQDDQLESLNRRYEFYVENVQPSSDALKASLGNEKVKLIDAHQPIYENGQLNLEKSIHRVLEDVIEALRVKN